MTDSHEPSPGHYVVLANPSQRSYCHSIAAAYATEVHKLGQSATICDLYGMAFNPVLSDTERRGHGDRVHPWLEAELRRLTAAEALVFVYPIWFGGPPAMLKGYVDRVLGAHFQLERLRDDAFQPVLRGRLLLSITTSGASADWLEGRAQPKALREGFDLYIARGFGLHDVGHLAIDRVRGGMEQVRASEGLERVAETARAMCIRLLR